MTEQDKSLNEDKDKSLNEIAKQADAGKLLDAKEQINEMIGVDYGEEVKASHSGKIYHIAPVSLTQVPKMCDLLNQIVTSAQNLPDGADDMQTLTANDGAMINVMAEIIQLGVAEGISLEKAKDEFSMGDFPKILSLTLDMNDFLAGMRTAFESWKVK